MFEPFFDQYLASVTFNGGKPVYVPLHPQTDKEKPSSADWKIDYDELRFDVPRHSRDRRNSALMILPLITNPGAPLHPEPR